jgi:murein DD-endopeptidase MepM/ murein hydrolase activator NlpD
LLRRARLLSASWSEAQDSLQFHFDRLAALPSILPTNGSISSSFSRMRQHPILNRARPHEGVDITAPRGTAIVAAAKGRVRFVGYQGEFGLMVEIDHGFGYITRYAHASRALVRAGQQVKRGDTIAQVGETGLAVGPHLHYEVLLNGRAINPKPYLMDLSVIPD